MKDVFDLNNLDLSKVCKSFGLAFPPQVNLNIRITPSSHRRKKLKSENGKNFYGSVKTN